MVSLASIVDIPTLLQLIAVSFVVAVGFVIAFSFGIFGFMRYGELRSERAGAAIAHVIVGLIGFLIAGAAIAYGIVEIAF